MRRWAPKFDDVDIPADLVEKAKEYRDKMVEAAAESDDQLIEKYLEGAADYRSRDHARVP